MFVRPLGYYGVYAKKLFVRVPRLKKKCSREDTAIVRLYPRPSPPRRKRPSSSRYAVPPPPELSASTAELTITSTITTATLRGLFSRGLFSGEMGHEEKKTEKSLQPKSYLLSYPCKDRQQQHQQPTKTHYHETLLRFIRQLHRPQPGGIYKWIC